MNIPPLALGRGIKQSPTIKIPEGLVVSSCIKMLYQWGLQPIRNNTGAFKKSYKNKKTGLIKEYHIRVGKEGSGDIICCTRRGTWLEIECKATTGKQTPEQKQRQLHIESIGGIYILAYSLDDLLAIQDKII